MADQPPKDQANPFAAWLDFAGYAARAQAVMLDAMAQQSKTKDGFQLPDPRVVTDAFSKAADKLTAEPDKLAEAQAELIRRQAALMQHMAKRLSGEDSEPVAAPAKGDKRFADAAWTEQPLFDLIKQSYLIGAEWLQGTMRGLDDLDPATQRKLEFYTRQWVDAVAPSNFLLTNPVALRAAVETKGESLRKGMEQLLGDLEKGRGRLAISMTDEKAFRLGENVAVSPGKVVYQNELMQLIQYAPATETVHRRPLLIVPPWINKFYILDLRPKNSFIKWAVDQGLTVFVISWINPGRDLAHKSFEDYMVDGPLAALDAVAKATGETDANVIGYCIGGTLTACTLSVMQAKGDRRINSVTYFTALTDFEDAGELKVFIDEPQLAMLDRHLEEKGYLEGHHMAQVFNMMRDNDLIWSFVVNNYLLGKEPFPFDLLYWNSDSTRMPAMMHRFYLRNMYLDNKVVQPGGITLQGVPVDLRKVAVPTYILSTREDHIAPWKATYAATQLYSGPVRFVLAGSGHIAGVVNPPSANKYNYWTNDELPAVPDAWFAGAESHPGSWWGDWGAWIAAQSGEMVPARKPGGKKLKPIEDAPGSYVKMRLVE